MWSSVCGDAAWYLVCSMSPSSGRSSGGGPGGRTEWGGWQRPNEGKEESLKRKVILKMKPHQPLNLFTTRQIINYSNNLRPSLLLLRTLAALRLLARKDNVGVISRSTILLSHGLRARLRSAGRKRKTNGLMSLVKCEMLGEHGHMENSP